MQEETKDAPKVTDHGWNDYVMSLFTPDEVVIDEESKKPCPRVNALWRVTELLLGPIIEYDCEVTKAPLSNEDKTATVRAWVVVAGNDTFPAGKYAGAADGSEFNINQGFEKFPVAITETRAKGRALRTALRLHKAIAAEERVTRPAYVEPEVMTDTQLNMIDKAASTANVNVSKFIKDEALRAKVDISGLFVTQLPKEFGSRLCREITKYQSKGSAPDHLTGYDPKWRKRS